jgi:alkylmercury lyase
MKNKTELKKFYELLLAKLPKESVPILRTIFFSIRDGQAVTESSLINQTGINTKTVQSVVKILAQRQMIVREADQKIVGALGLSIIPTTNQDSFRRTNFICLVCNIDIGAVNCSGC